jgi:hypothetical protein
MSESSAAGGAGSGAAKELSARIGGTPRPGLCWHLSVGEVAWLDSKSGKVVFS